MTNKASPGHSTHNNGDNALFGGMTSGDIGDHGSGKTPATTAKSDILGGSNNDLVAGAATTASPGAIVSA